MVPARIITHSAGGGKVIRVLSTLIADQPQLMLEFSQQVKDLFDYMSTLCPPVVEDLLNALSPLLRLRPDLLDYVVLVLRKAVFNKESNSRLVAVAGFVELIMLESRDEGDSALDSRTHRAQGSSDLCLQTFG